MPLLRLTEEYLLSPAELEKLARQSNGPRQKWRDPDRRKALIKAIAAGKARANAKREAERTGPSKTTRKEQP